MGDSADKVLRFVEQLARAELTDPLEEGIEGEPWSTLARHLEEVRRVWQQERSAAVEQAVRQVVALSEVASKDGLTGLLNRRAMTQVLEKEMRRARGDNRPLAIAMLDLDFFKRTNDTYGHAAGDAVLRAVAKVLLASIRDSDFAFRPGGEEFVVVLPGAPRGVAEERVLAILERVRSLRILHEEVTIKTTVSAGLASFPEDAADVERLMKTADAAMYRAKAAGRDRLELATADDVPAA